MVLNRTGSIWDRENRNSINENWDVLDKFLKNLNDLVIKGQLTPTQFAELIKELNGLISRGQVSVHDIDKNKGLLDQSFLSPELLEQIAGTAPILSTIADGAVTSSKVASKAITPGKTTFFEGADNSNNLFDGNYVDGWIGLDTGSSGTYSTRKNGTTYLGKTAVIPIEPNTSYAIRTATNADTLRVAVSSSYPIFESTTGTPESRVEIVVNAQTSRGFHILGRENANYLIINNTLNYVEYPLVVVEGTEVPSLDSTSLKIPSKYIRLEDFSNNGFPQFQFEIGGINFNGELNSDRNRAITTTFPLREGFYVGIQDNDVYNFWVSGWDRDTGEYLGSFEKIPGSSRESYITKDCIARIGVLKNNDAELTESDLEEVRKLLFTSRYNKNHSTSEGASLTKDGRYSMNGNFYEYYQHEIMGHWSNPNGITPTQFHDRFKQLIDSHDIAYRNLLGQDDFGNNIYEYGIKNTEYFLTDTGSNNPGISGELLKMGKIFITSGIHGREKSTNYAVYEVFKAILENPNNLEALESIKSNIHLVSIPICNPSGFIDNSYYNRNNVPIGNSFTPGTHQNTQPESILIRNSVDSHSDMDFYIDLHNMFARDGLIGFTMTNTEMFRQATGSVYKSVGRRWQKESSDFPQSYNHRWAYTTTANATTITDYTSSILNAQSALIEFPRESEFIPNSSVHDTQVTTLGTEVLMNFIFACIRSKQ